jgi:hypothetical protein
MSKERLPTAIAIINGEYTGPRKVGPFFIGNWYETRGGSFVQIVGAKTVLKGYETVYDQHGHHRYARSIGSGEDNGRCTGCKWDDPRNIPLFQGPKPEFE